MSEQKANTQKTAEELHKLAEDIDTGGREPQGLSLKILLSAAFLWSLFQLWIASPIQFSLNFFILNDTETRSIHLAFAVFLAFLSYPLTSKSPRNRIPAYDWLLALVAAFCAAYLYIFYRELANRPGLPTQMDIYIACVGMVLLLEATRRALGPPLMIVSIIFLFYTFAGAWDIMPDMISHKGQSLEKVASHQWLATEGVYGIALGVSTSFVFLFVLFGALLDKAGAGNYFIQLAFALLGHMKGGPAKAAVLSSGMTGLISGSSIANVVTTGTFTVPLMRKVGFTREKAGAVEVAASVNGQIMPPVMGAAAFLMVEYVGIPYVQVIKHAVLPAIISYIALLYMVHLEALKEDMPTLPKRKNRTLPMSLLLTGIVICSFIIFGAATFYIISFLKSVMGDNSTTAIMALIAGGYLLLLWYKSRYPDLAPEDPNVEIVHLPETGVTFKTGMHYLLPIVVLVWCLMVERLSPGLSAYWATMFMIVILLTQHPILALMRKQGNLISAFTQGMSELRDGMITGARNMVGIGVATAAAGIIVGTVSLTGIGQVLTEVIEAISGGSMVIVLILTALISLVLGMGLPTTANYIVVSSLMAPVLIELSAQSGLIVPLIAIHMFVFYFGIMADVTPPVGLASFAAAAVSGGDPIRTGIQAFMYSSRTVILPFLFIYNTDLLLVDVDSIWHGIWIFCVATTAILMFSAGVQGYFVVRNKAYESALLLLIAFSMFNPQFWVNTIIPPFKSVPVSTLSATMEEMQPGDSIRLFIDGFDRLGDPKSFVVSVPIPEGETGDERLEAFGISMAEIDGRYIIEDIGFNSPAEKAGLDFDYAITKVETPQNQPSKRLVYIPALLLLFFVWIVQRTRKKAINKRNLEPAV